MHEVQTRQRATNVINKKAGPATYTRGSKHLRYRRIKAGPVTYTRGSKHLKYRRIKAGPVTCTRGSKHLRYRRIKAGPVTCTRGSKHLRYRRIKAGQGILPAFLLPKIKMIDTKIQRLTQKRPFLVETKYHYTNRASCTSYQPTINQPPTK